MGKLASASLGLLLGLVLGALGALSLGGGAMMGAGVATGLSTGICATMTAAEAEGLLSAAEVDQVLVRAARDLGGPDSLPAGEAPAGSAAQCHEVMARLRPAAAN